jgi:hypothetical protein
MAPINKDEKDDRRSPRLGTQAFIRATSITDRYLSREEQRAERGQEPATQYHSHTPALADEGAKLMGLEGRALGPFPFTPRRLRGKQKRIGNLERAKAALLGQVEKIDQAITHHKNDVARWTGQIVDRVAVKTREQSASGTLAYNAKPLLQVIDKAKNATADHRRVLKDLKTTVAQVTEERDLLDRRLRESEGRLSFAPAEVRPAPRPGPRRPTTIRRGRSTRRG